MCIYNLRVWDKNKTVQKYGTDQNATLLNISPKQLSAFLELLSLASSHCLALAARTLPVARRGRLPSLSLSEA